MRVKRPGIHLPLALVATILAGGCGLPAASDTSGGMESPTGLIRSEQIPGMPISLANPQRFEEPAYQPGERTAALPRLGEKGWTIDFTVHEELNRGTRYYLVVAGQRERLIVDVTRELSASPQGRLSTGDMRKKNLTPPVSLSIEEGSLGAGQEGNLSSNSVVLEEEEKLRGEK
jgi:hypothetical protein